MPRAVKGNYCWLGPVSDVQHELLSNRRPWGGDSLDDRNPDAWRCLVDEKAVDRPFDYGFYHSFGGKVHDLMADWILKWCWHFTLEEMVLNVSYNDVEGAVSRHYGSNSDYWDGRQFKASELMYQVRRHPTNKDLARYKAKKKEGFKAYYLRMVRRNMRLRLFIAYRASF